ncbi:MULTISPECIES: single-stranded DNA-binding protein [Romboutsia]|uniref:Single-stranded DNA-binding protein n=1 Tax=Romboutsia hominis TaxID=1507512 RepID=A0A2P2BYS3_9FIRM|nr:MULTISPECIES: single-stranded DNA-binding protein [Romboutsia]MCH1958879.1 single-stranded DNA-binding protein [Romboutsia hominis]MCH1968006.1 single-stranded DNA-binding protein [Romboutsia hominis]MDB8790788.1 single-stranded DNA-binding protein [Romboutsia sp. 1001216sp1]MDB8794014.1 single-stranded DNA-binding protein [Romboutsia sp. 1001216sp1]MDB8796941.1 single-stranded DNA-binding protein [Romboutsia sp. 1001216sp1]
MNHVVLVGRLTRDPELRYIAGSGTPVANFSIAIDREFSGKDGKRETDFIDIQVWGKSAENCANYIGKGSLVAVQGSIRVDVYQNQAGENRRAFRVNANRVQFLDSRNKSENSYNKGSQTGFEPSFEPTFEPQGLDPQGFQAIDDDDIPF